MMDFFIDEHPNDSYNRGKKIAKEQARLNKAN